MNSGFPLIRRCSALIFCQVLDDHVRIIQGDGIKYETLVEILEFLKQAGWSAENIGFGSGGGLLQKLDRDTQKFAFKCRYAHL